MGRDDAVNHQLLQDIRAMFVEEVPMMVRKIIKEEVPSMIRAVIQEEVPEMIRTAITEEVPEMIAKQTQPLAAGLTSLTRTVDRIDQRLTDVERRMTTVQQDIANMKKHTKLIPGIAKAVGANSADLDNHERRLQRLEIA